MWSAVSAQPSSYEATGPTHVRDAERAARRLIARAAYLEKRARRPRADPAERDTLNAQARELRMAAAGLMAEVSEVARQFSLA